MAQKNLRSNIVPVPGMMTFKCDLCERVAKLPVTLEDTALIRNGTMTKLTAYCEARHPTTVGFQRSGVGL